MPVRSHGLLLAGMAVVLGLCMAGAGCESLFPTPGAPAAAGSAPAVGGRSAGFSDAFAMRPANGHPSRGLLSFLHPTPAPTQTPMQKQEQPQTVFTGQPLPPGSTPGMAGPAVSSSATPPPNRYVVLPTTQPAYTAGSATSATPVYPGVAPAALPGGVPVSNSSAQPALMLRPVPPTVPAAPQRPPVIASSWQPVQHIEPAATGPELGGGVPVGETPSQPASAPAPPGPVAVHNVVDLAPPAGTAIATSAAPDKAPERKPAVPEEGDIGLPPPRPLVPTPVPAAEAVPVVLPGPPPGGPPHGPPPVPREFHKQALPPYVVEPPDILLIEASTAITDPLQPLAGQHLVRPDGTISLGLNGTVPVTGLTVEQIRDAIAATLLAGPLRNSKKQWTLEQVKSELNVDVMAYNSKFYYIITDGGGYGAQVYRFPITGNETVLDALSQIYGLPTVASKKKIVLARATPDHAHPKVFPVDWYGLVKRGSAATNYQVYPGDRIYVESDALIRTDSFMAKFLSPILRGFGATLLGASTVNDIKLGSAVGGVGGFGGFGAIR
jgi:polysaccharide export outer membrane protein